MWRFLWFILFQVSLAIIEYKNFENWLTAAGEELNTKNEFEVELTELKQDSDEDQDDEEKYDYVFPDDSDANFKRICKKRFRSILSFC